MDRYIKNLLNSKSEKNSGTINISSGGIVTNMSLKNGAELNVSSGGFVRNVTNPNGMISIFSGGEVRNSKYEFSISSASVKGGDLYVSSCHCSNVNVDEGNFVINNGVYAYDTIASGTTSGNATARGHVIIRGVASGLTIYPERDFFFRGDEKGSGYTINISGGSGVVESGAYVTDVSVISSGYIRVYGNMDNASATGSGHIFINGSAINISAIESGDIFIEKNASATVINISSGRMSVSGSANIININHVNDYVSVGSGGTATYINNKGYLTVSNGGYTSNVENSSGGRFFVRSSGYASAVGVNSGASVYVSYGGICNSATVRSGGVLEISSGGIGINCGNQSGILDVLSGGNLYIRDNIFPQSGITVLGGGVAVSSGAGISSSVINSGGTIYVSSGGSANDTTIYNGTLYLDSNTKAREVTVQSGYCNLKNGTSVTSVTVDNLGNLTLFDQSKAEEILVNPGGLITISGNGLVSDVTLSGGGLNISGSGGRVIGASGSCGVSASIRVLNGGSASEVKLNGTSPSPSGFPHLVVYNGGYAKDVSLTSRGTVYISGGAKADLVSTVNTGGNIRVYGNDSNPAIVKDVSVNSGGILTINEQVAGGSSGESAVVSSARISGGTATVFSKGIINYGYIYNGVINNSFGGLVSNYSVNSDGHINIYGGTAKQCGANAKDAYIDIIDNYNGLIDHCSCFNSGTINVRNSATNLIAGNGGIINLYKNANGNVSTYLNSVTVQAGGALKVNSGTSCDNITMQGGSMIASSYGNINSLTVRGGTADLYGNNSNVEIHGGKVNQYAGIINFFLSNGLTHSTNKGITDGNIYGNLILTSGGEINNETVNTQYNSIGVQSNATLNISSGASAVGVANWGHVTISSGGTYRNGNQPSYNHGQVTVFNGGIADIYWQNGGKINISIDSKTGVSITGAIYVSAGKYLSTEIRSGYGIWMTNQGSFSDNSNEVNVLSGGTLTMNPGATTNKIVNVSSGGSVHMASSSQIPRIYPATGAIVTVG